MEDELLYENEGISFFIRKTGNKYYLISIESKTKVEIKHFHCTSKIGLKGYMEGYLACKDYVTRKYGHLIQDADNNIGGYIG